MGRQISQRSRRAQYYKEKQVLNEILKVDQELAATDDAVTKFRADYIAKALGKKKQNYKKNCNHLLDNACTKLDGQPNGLLLHTTRMEIRMRNVTCVEK